MIQAILTRHVAKYLSDFTAVGLLASKLNLAGVGSFLVATPKPFDRL